MNSKNETRSSGSGIFDFFISYKRRDSELFVTKLAEKLRARNLDIWLDNDEIHPGDSIFESIESGLNSSIDAVVVLSENYYVGWSARERNAIYSLMISKKLRVIPIWYKLGEEEISSATPMFIDIKAIQVLGDSDAEIASACDTLTQSFRPDQRRSRLFEMFFRCISQKYPEDWDLKLFLAVYDNNMESLEDALNKGADVNITDGALWNRYNRKALDCGCWNEWRKLFLYLSEIGMIGH